MNDAHDENEKVDPAKIATEINALKQEIHRLNNQMFFRLQNKWLSLILFNVVRGLFFGLGSVVGATLLVYGFILFLQQIDFIPIIGEWATRVIAIIQSGKAPS